MQLLVVMKVLLLMGHLLMKHLLLMRHLLLMKHLLLIKHLLLMRQLKILLMILTVEILVLYTIDSHLIIFLKKELTEKSGKIFLVHVIFMLVIFLL